MESNPPASDPTGLTASYAYHTYKYTSKSGYWESNPGVLLGKQTCYRNISPADGE